MTLNPFKLIAAIVAQAAAALGATKTETPAETIAPQVYRRTLPPVRRRGPKIGRNDPCPCGAEIELEPIDGFRQFRRVKYKHCCLAKDQADPRRIYRPAF